jgi:hypothetical protein
LLEPALTNAGVPSCLLLQALHYRPGKHEWDVTERR